MLNQVRYSGISSKVKAMSAGLISPSMYKEISSISSVPEFTAYLCEHTPYGKYLLQTDIRLLHRVEIETFLYNGVYEDFKKLYRFADQNQRFYLKLYFKIFEIEFLKKCIRRVMSDRHASTTIVSPDNFFMEHTHLKTDALLSAYNMSELTELLKGTEYHDIIFVVFAYQNSSPFDYELALNLYYYQTIWKTLSKKCSGPDADILTHSYGIRIDLLNLTSIYRGKFHFHLENAKVIPLTILCNYKLKKSELSGFVQCSSIAEFNELLAATYYGRHFSIDNANTLIQKYQTVSWNTDKKSAKNNPYTIAAIFSYLVDKEEERKRLVRALEAIRYGLNQRQILEYINGGSIE